MELEDRCQRLGINYLKLIAPVTGGTEVGDLSEELEKIVRAAGVETRVPRGAIGPTVAALLMEFNQQLTGCTERVRTVYMGEDSSTFLQRPADWPVPLLPYL